MTRRKKSAGSGLGDGDSARSAFEKRFRVTARRVLERHGVPESRIEAEIDRLRRSKPGFELPTVEELERLLSEPVDRS